MARAAAKPMPTPAADAGGCLLLIGPDRVRKSERITALIASLAIDLLDRHTLDGPACTAERLGTLAREVPGRGARKLVVIEQAQRLPEASIGLLAEQLPALTATTWLVLVVDGKLEAKHPLAKLQAPAQRESFEWLSEAEVAAWIAQWVEGRGKRIAAPAIAELTSACGPDLAALSALLEQLVLWIGDRPQISQADCREFVGGADRPGPPVADAGRGAFALVEAIGRRQTALALRIAHEQLVAGKDVLELLGMIGWQLQRWVTVGRLLTARMSKPRIESLTGIKAWQLDRVQSELAGRDATVLGDLLGACLALDVGLKTGRVAPRVGLDALIVRLCEAGAARR